MKGVNHNTRGQLIANQEQTKRNRFRTQSEPFGTYRPLTEASFLAVKPVVEAGAAAIASMLEKDRGATALCIPQPEMGITFSTRTSMRRALGRGGLQHLEVDRTLADLHALCDNNDEFTVPIEEFDWYGNSCRKLVGLLAVNADGYDELLKQGQAISEILEPLRSYGLIVAVPDHLSLMRYGSYQDGQDLSRLHREKAADIMQGHFQDAGIEAVTFDGLVAGNTYMQRRELVA